MTDNERKAIQLSENRGELRQRLLDAKSRINRAAQIHYAPWKFDFQAKCLVSDSSEKAVLQWQTRKQPERPISYENQQTSMGIVVLKKGKS
jgi:hypothetical protein